jgi:hypothetical protein
MATLKLNSYELFSQSSNNQPQVGSGLPNGMIVDVQQALKTDTFETQSTSYVDVPGLAVTLTPKFAGNKVLIMCNIHAASGFWVGHIGLFQDNTELGLADAASNRSRGFLDFTMDNNASADGINALCTGQLLIPVGNTSSRTYKIKASYRYDNQSAGEYLYINRSKTDRDTNTYDHRHVSTITVMEISA